MEDGRLVNRIKSGEIEAFESLVRKYQGRLVSFVNRIVFDEIAAEEVVQDTFFKVYRTIGRVDEKRKFSTYIYEIAKNGAYSYLRKHKKTVSINDEMADPRVQMIEDHGLERVLSKLEMKYRQVVRMYYWDDLAYDEIAGKLGLPINTIRTHLRRAKGQLKKLLT